MEATNDGTTRGVWSNAWRQEGIYNKVSYVAQHPFGAVVGAVAAPINFCEYVCKTAYNNPKTTFSVMVLLSSAIFAIEMFGQYIAPMQWAGTSCGSAFVEWETSYLQGCKNLAGIAVQNVIEPMECYVRGFFPLMDDCEAMISYHGEF